MAVMTFPLDEAPELKAYLEQHGCVVKRTETARGTPVDEITFPEGTQTFCVTGGIERVWSYTMPDSTVIYVQFLKSYEGQAALMLPTAVYHQLLQKVSDRHHDGRR